MSIDKLKQSVLQEIQKLEKKTVSLKKDIDNLLRDKEGFELDVKEAESRKKQAIDEAVESSKKADALKVEIKQLKTDKLAVEAEIKKLQSDAEKREIQLTADTDEIARLKAEVLEVNQKSKRTLNENVQLQTKLNNKLKEVDMIQESWKQKACVLSDKEVEIEELKEKADKELEDAENVNANAKSARLELQVATKELMDEKDKHASLIKSLEVRHEEKNKEIVKAQELIARIKERELKVKQDESFLEEKEKSLASERNRVALLEAKAAKILNVLTKDKKIQDQLESLGLKI